MFGEAHKKMKNLLRFNGGYFIITAVLFCIEVGIARYAHDKIIRPYIGDVLVVALIYCFVKSFFNTGIFITAFGVLLFSYFIEMLQYFNIVKLLGLQKSGTASVVLGTYFEWLDLAAYTAGIAVVIALEMLRTKRNKLAR
jgi:Protein of unknown function (DUF2809)